MNTMDIEKIRMLVEKRLQELKISQVLFSQLAGMTQPTLCRFLNGDTIPTIETVNKIVKTLIKLRGKRDSKRAA